MLYSFFLTLLSVVFFFPPSAFSQDNGHFFPERPANAKIHSVQGTLTSFAHGQAIGCVEIRTNQGKSKEFYMGYPYTVNGKPTKCFDAERPAPDFCDDWPSNIKVGSTIVRVFYWKTLFNGKPVMASDALVAIK